MPRPEPKGEMTKRVFAHLEMIARAGKIAPTQTEIAHVVGCSSGGVTQAVKGLLRDGFIEMRADAAVNYRRCYRIVATGWKTEGFDRGLPVEEVRAISQGRGPDRVLAALSALAGRGLRADLAVLRGMVHMSQPRVLRVIDELAAEGAIEIRTSPVHPSRRSYRIVATGAETAGFAEGVPCDPAGRLSRRASQAGENMAPGVLVQKPEARMRKCMACDAVFRSTGPGHRLCAQHRSDSAPVTVHRIAAMR